IGGNFLDVPPIHTLLVATFSMYLQSVRYWWQLSRCTSNLQNIGGTSNNIPPIIMDNDGMYEKKQIIFQLR
ncbi:MAG: hypothetical protein L0L14_03095, partial [Tetragenococcus koreensis]|nr:hypothetical protein [Tetragenococcus koreensis]